MQTGKGKGIAKHLTILHRRLRKDHYNANHYQKHAATGTWVDKIANAWEKERSAESKRTNQRSIVTGNSSKRKKSTFRTGGTCKSNRSARIINVVKNHSQADEKIAPFIM